MKTSYFAKYKGNNAVSIALSTPKWFNGESYSDLYPKWDFINQYKKDKDIFVYMNSYHNEILSKLDPDKVYNDLKDSVILCWEKSGDFCHRRVVAHWIEYNTGIKVIEYKMY
jgi:uncharacterized protein (DUF488 family)